MAKRRKSSKRSKAAKKAARTRRRRAHAGVCNASFTLAEFNPKTGKKYRAPRCMRMTKRGKVSTHTPRKPKLIASPFPLALNGTRRRRRRR